MYFHAFLKIDICSKTSLTWDVKNKSWETTIQKTVYFSIINWNGMESCEFVNRPHTMNVTNLSHKASGE